MSGRGKWQGMWTIVRFNWPFYLIALIVLGSASYGFFASDPYGLKICFGIALSGALYFLVGSLGVSHIVYDCSDLYRWKWLTRALAGTQPRGIIFCHSGFDEASFALRQLQPVSDWQVLDHYHPALMTEASIRRARKHFPPTEGTLSAPYNRWPVAADTADVVFGLLAIHELRSEAARTEWFGEAKRCLKHGGRVVLAEHVRDFANFFAFGPGFMHFHSGKSWRACWDAAGLHVCDEFKVTPWVRIYVLSKPWSIP